MFEPLLAVADDLDQLDKTLKSPDSAQRAKAICAALDETAQRIADATPSAKSDRTRSDLQRLFRGMVAARRLIAQLS